VAIFESDRHSRLFLFSGMTMNTQLVSGSKLALALAISAVLGACGGGGGGGGDSSTPVATTPAATAPSTPATTPTATTPATNSPVATAPAATAPTPASNTQGAALVNRAMYEQMRRECQTPSGPSDPAVVACAAGVYVGRDLWDGKECTVKLAKDGEVTFTVGDKVHVFRMTEFFQYHFVNSSAERAPYLLDVHISGYSAEDATEKSHGFMLNVNPKGDGSTLPDSIEIGYKYGGKISSDELASCKMPL